MMEKRGLVKLMEECGELVQAAAKKSAYMETDLHPDGQSLQTRLEEEIADVCAACYFVTETFRLDKDVIARRTTDKFNMFSRWHKEGQA
jgi:NTP pyrophosphatase (non-canonical NTP hydrolase)